MFLLRAVSAGLRFLRIVNMLWLVHLLHRFRVVRSAAQVELARLVVYITMAVIIGAGAFLLVSAEKRQLFCMILGLCQSLWSLILFG